MLNYQFEEEKDYATYYAKELERPIILTILNRGQVKNADEAKALSVFFWDMVDKSIQNERNGVTLRWTESAEFWNKKLLHTFSGHLKSVGYTDIWDQIVDEQ